MRRTSLVARLAAPLLISALALGGCTSHAEELADSSPIANDEEGGTDGDDGGETGGAPSEDDENAEEELDTGDSNEGESPVGTNLSGVNEWTPAVPFIDLMRQSQGWVSGTTMVWDDGRTVEVDEHGWPTSLLAGQIAQARVYDYLEGTPLLWSRLIVRYDGTGTLAYQGGVTRNETLSAAGREVLDVDPDSPSMFLAITSTDPNDPIRNIRIVPDAGMCSDGDFTTCSEDADCSGAGTCDAFEDIHEERVFHPELLRRIRSYRTLRFMDWMDTNATEQTTWDQRPHMLDFAWTRDGVPVEVMVKLANLLHVDPWFTVPHSADDDYVRQFATVIRDTLDPSLTVYIEHSNEVWNGVFPQAAYAEQRGLAAGLSDDPHRAKLRWHAQRSVEIFAIWEDVFGGTERLVRVMGSQAGSAGASVEVLDHANAYEHTDALAVAPYFGGYLGDAEWESKLESMSVDDLFAELETVAVPRAIEWMQWSAEIANERGVELIAYEGGQHLVAHGPMRENPAIDALLNGINRHPRMKDLYLEYLHAWQDFGGLFVHFTDCAAMNKWGRWGTLEHSGQPREEAPKLDAILTFIETMS